jgi:hypothetical protein
MGLENNGNKIYLSVADGKIVQRVKEDGQDVTKRTTDDGKIIFEKKHNALSGMLTGISVSEKEFNGKPIKQWNFDIEDGGQVYQLQIKYSSGYSTSLLKALANPEVDFSKPIRIAPWAKTINDKKKTSIYLSQGGEDIKWYFTKDEPNGLPEMKQIKVKGEMVWDDYDMMQFFEAFVKKEIVPKLSKGKSAAVAEPAGYGPNNTPEEDDLPF